MGKGPAKRQTAAQTLVRRLQAIAVNKGSPSREVWLSSHEIRSICAEAADTIKRWEDIHADELGHTMREMEQLGITDKIKAGMPCAVLIVAEIDRLKKLEKSVEGLRDCPHQEHFSTRLNADESRHLLNAFSYLNDRHDRGAPTRAGRDMLGCPTIE